MSNKVKLPKAVCDALDWAKDTKQSTNSEICYYIQRKSFKQPIEVLNEQDADLIMRALVLGYEPELSAEEQMKERYENRGDYCTHEHFLGYRDGVKDTLHLHGIKYDWIKGWGEDDAE